MPSYSSTSKEKLLSCHQDLQTIFNYVIKYLDNTIVCGERNEHDQNKAFDKGFSKVKYPNSKHNSTPSMAVDAVPYPIDWSDTNRMKYFAGYVMGIAKMLKRYGTIEHDLISGLDWDNDTELKDTTFMIVTGKLRLLITL